MKRRTYTCTILVFLLMAGVLAPVTLMADEATPAPATETTRMTETTDATTEAGVLPTSLQSELQQRSAEYRGDYQAAGESSTIRIHWPTVAIVLLVIIIL